MDNISTGIPPFDTVLGGGVHAGSLVFLVGGPGVGKTILAHQICFALGTPEHKALYYSMSSEPSGKLIDHLQQFAFFDRAALGERVDYLQIAGMLEESDGTRFRDRWHGVLDTVADEIARASSEQAPAVIVIDSARALRDVASSADDFRGFVYELASRVAHTGALLLLVGEYSLDDIILAPEFAVADGIVYLANEPFGRFDQRWLRVVKMRANAHLSGKHAFRFGPQGIEVYPRFEAIAPNSSSLETHGRMPFGVPALDKMLDGGLPRASSTLIAGPSGSGKTVLALHFIAEGLARGERCMFLSFQQTEARLVARAKSFGWDFASAVESGLLSLRYLKPVEISLDIIGAELLEATNENKVQRLVIDSLAEIEPAARGTGRFPDYLSALTSLCRSVGTSSLLTSETAAFFGPSFELPHGLAFVADNVMLLRYVELDAEVHGVLGIMKMRDGHHDRSLVQISIGPTGMQIDRKFTGLTGVLEGTPTHDVGPFDSRPEGRDRRS